MHRYLYAYSNPTVYIDLYGNAALTEYLSEKFHEAADNMEDYVDQMDKNLDRQYFNEEINDAQALGRRGGAASIGASSLVPDLLGSYLGVVNNVADLYLGYNPIFAFTDTGKKARKEFGDRSQAVQEGVKSVAQGGVKFTQMSAEQKQDLLSQVGKSVVTGAEDALYKTFIEGDLNYTAGLSKALVGELIPGKFIDDALGLVVKNKINLRHANQIADADELDGLIVKLGGRAVREASNSKVANGMTGREAGAYAEELFESYLAGVNRRLLKYNSKYSVEIQPATLPGYGRVPGFVEYAGGRIYPFRGSLRLDAALSDTSKIVTTPAISTDVYPSILKGYDITLDINKKSAIKKYSDSFGVPISDIRP